MKKITLFVVAMFVALTTFAADITGGTKFFLDLRTPSGTIGKNNDSYKIVFTNGETASDTITLAYNGAKIYRFVAPAGTWTGIKVIPAKSYYMHLTYDGTNNYFAAAKNPADALTLVDNRMVYVDTDGTWSQMPVADIVGGTKFYIDFSQNSTCKNSKYFPATVKFASFDGATVSEAVTVEYNAELADVYEVVAPEGTWSRIIFQQKSLNRLDLTYDGVNNLFTLNKTTSQASLLNMDGSYSVYLNNEGVWSKAATPFEGGQVFYLDPTANEGFVQTFDAYKAVFKNAEGTYSAPVEMTKAGSKYKVVVPEGTWVSFDIDCYLEGEAEVTIAGLAYDGENTMFSVDATATATAVTGTWGAPRGAVEATWNIAEGDTLEFFKEVRITFAGYDSVGRKFVGATATDMFTEVTNVVLANGSTLKTFFSVDEEGNTTPVPGGNGVLYSSRDGLTCIFSINTKGYEENEQGFYAKGNYRIVLPGCSLQCAKARTGMPKVYLEEDYVLNFTIDNNYVKKTAVTAEYTALPANEERLTKINEIVLTFPQYDSVFVNATDAKNGFNWLGLEYLQVIPGDDDLGTPATSTWTTAAPMQWAAVEGVKNAVRIFVSEAMCQKTFVNDLGEYKITIPEGIISFTRTDAAETYNKEFTLNYTVVEPTFMLTVNVNDAAKGTVDVATGEQKVGAVVTLTATPAEGYKLLGWSDRSTEETLTVTMDTNKVVTAYFVKDYEFAPRFTVEKVWENVNVPASTGNGYQAVGFDGVIYMQDAGNLKLHTITADAITEYAASGAGQQIAVDNAGNLIVFNATFYSANPNAIKVFQKGSTEAKDLTFTLPYPERCDFLTASGDIFGAEGGYVYFYCKAQTVVNRVQIANGEVVAVDAVGGALAAGNTQNNVMLDIWGNLVAHSRSTSVSSYNFTTGESKAFTLNGFKLSTLGGCSFELGGKELWAYNVGTTNYNSEWNIYNYTDAKFVSETAFYTKDVTSTNTAANWLTVQVVEDTAYIYQFCPKVGAALWKVTFTTEPIEVSTMEELKANEGELVLYKGLEPAAITVGEGWMSYTEYFMPDSATALTCDLYPVPAKMDVYGTLTEEGFVVEKVATVHSFFTMNDLMMFMESATDEQKMASYEIKESVLVTLAGPMSFYVQYEEQGFYGGSTWKGLAAQTGRMTMLSFQPKAGDEITLKGAYSAAMYDEETGAMIQPAFFSVETANLVSENNKLNYASVDLSTGLAYISDYYASLSRLSKGGKIVLSSEGNYCYEFDFETWVETENGYEQLVGKDSLVLMAAGPVDFEEYLNKDLDKLVVGVIDFDLYTQAPIVYVTELQDSKLYYNTIAELIAAGAQSEYTLTSALRNPVLLTYISYNKWGGYTIFVQDETGAIAVKGLGVLDENDEYTFPYEVAVGDSIVGIEGFTALEASAYMWSGNDYNVELNLTKVADGEITPLDITLADFNADVANVMEAINNGEFFLSEYANKVVRVQELSRVDDPDDEKWPWLVQGEDSIKVSTYYWGDIAVADSIVSLTGIADYTIINGQTASIQPLNPESVVVPTIDNVEYVILTDVYTENGLIVTEGEFQIFTITGQNVTDMNGRLDNGVYVVRRGNATAKVVVK